MNEPVQLKTSPKVFERQFSRQAPFSRVFARLLPDLTQGTLEPRRDSKELLISFWTP